MSKIEDESREKQYLRILTSGVSGESDYEAASYLKEKGYTDCKIEISKARESYGKIINIIGFVPTPLGFAYIEELRARIKMDDAQELGNPRSNRKTNTIVNQIGNNTTEWHNTGRGKIIIGVSVSLIVYCITSFF